MFSLSLWPIYMYNLSGIPSVLPQPLTNLHVQSQRYTQCSPSAVDQSTCTISAVYPVSSLSLWPIYMYNLSGIPSVLPQPLTNLHVQSQRYTQCPPPAFNQSTCTISAVDPVSSLSRWPIYMYNLSGRPSVLPQPLTNLHVQSQR